MSKKLFLCSMLAAVTLASPAYSQSMSSDPAADTPAACPAGANNCSLVTQSGVGNISDVQQPGTGNVAEIDQTGAPIAAGNIVEVDQTGNDNFAFVTQDTTAVNDTEVEAQVDQRGINSFVQIDQIGNESGGLATVLQNELVDFNFAQIEQTGEVGGGGNRGQINQINGFLNEAAIVQGRTTAFDGSSFSPAGVITDSQNGLAAIGQEGSLNSASLIQGGTNQIAIASQTNLLAPSAGNFSLIIQGSGAPAFSNFALVTQSGDGHTSEVYQNDEDDLSGGFQGGNQVIVLQDSVEANLSRISQNGRAHLVNVRQFDGSTAIVTQNGVGHTGTINQGVP